MPLVDNECHWSVTVAAQKTVVFACKNVVSKLAINCAGSVQMRCVIVVTTGRNRFPQTKFVKTEYLNFAVGE